jgi:membrane fusion protein, multidrug efflux system
MSEVDAQRTVPGSASARGGDGGSSGSPERPATTGAGSASTAPRSRRRGLLVIGALVLLGAMIAGAYLWMTRNQVGTDDATVDGHIVPISSRISGYVTEVRIGDNDRASRGDTLVVLDDRDLAARLAQVEADLEGLLTTAGQDGHAGQARAQLAAARATASAAEAAVVQAEANAENAHNDLTRYQSLAASNIVSRQQLDAAETNVRTAEARVLVARRNAQATVEQVVAAEAALSGADARVNAARAARDQIALQLSYARILAPVSGVISKRSVEPGQMLQPGQPLLSIVQLDSVWAVANMKETDVQHIRVGNPVEIRVDTYPGHRFAGHVQSIDPGTGSVFSLLPPDNATGNFVKVVQRIPVRITLDKPQDPEAILRPGMSIVVTIHTK